MTNLIAVLYHSTQDFPTVIQIKEESKFIDVCEKLPTTWAYLYNKQTETVTKVHKKDT